MDNFDHKAWLNRVLLTSDASDETSLTSLLLNLQRMLEVANQEVEATFHEVAQATPRLGGF